MHIEIRRRCYLSLTGWLLTGRLKQTPDSKNVAKKENCTSCLEQIYTRIRNMDNSMHLLKNIK